MGMSEPPYRPPQPGGNDPTVPYQTPAQYPQGYPQPQYAYPAVAPGYGVQQVDQWGRPLSDKSKIVAGVLGIALGGFGAGRFYTGHTGMAVAQLVVTLLTCGIGHFWGLIDGILILANGGTDAQGRVLRDT
jgi:TM2 domain-containing membrane protein YozV